MNGCINYNECVNDLAVGETLPNKILLQSSSRAKVNITSIRGSSLYQREID